MLRKKWVALTVTLTFICLAVSLSTVATAEERRIWFGVSDYELHVALNVTTIQKYAVARIHNTGNETNGLNFTVTAEWIPNDVATENGLSVEILDNPMLLTLETSKKVYVHILAKEVGEFSGKIQFSSNPILPSDYSGNPSLPGGSARCNFTVVGWQPPPPPQTNNTPIVLGCLLAVVAVLVVCVVGWRLRKR